LKAIKTTLAQSGPALYIKALIAGITTGSICLIILLIIFSTLLLISGTLPHNYLVWLDIFACAIASFTASLITARIIKHSGLVWGLISGMILFLIQFIAGLCSSDTITYITFIKLLMFLLTGALGGIKGVNKKEKLRIK